MQAKRSPRAIVAMAIRRAPKEDRAERMRRWLAQGLVGPNLIGAHSFLFRDQPLQGHPDGEATPRGLK